MEDKTFPVKTVLTANGTRLIIFQSNDGLRFVKLASIAMALGYAKYHPEGSLLALALKSATIPIYTLFVRTKQSFCVREAHVISLLQRFINLTLMLPKNLSKTKQLTQDNARMEAERLIELFNTEVFGKPSTCKIIAASEEPVKENATDNKEEVKMEPLQILKASDEPNDRQNNAVHVLTVEDIEDIGNRASSLGKVYGFSLKQSLIAATKLKAEEINRDLSVILETCKGE